MGGGLTTSCSRTQVKSWGRKTALQPAARAGLMSDLGLLPIIHVEWGWQVCFWRRER